MWCVARGPAGLGASDGESCDPVQEKKSILTTDIFEKQKHGWNLLIDKKDKEVSCVLELRM